jgi:hypothetical protein
MIENFCGDCGKSCDVEVDWHPYRAEPVALASECCGAEVFSDSGLSHALTVLDFTPGVGN